MFCAAASIGSGCSAAIMYMGIGSSNTCTVLKKFAKATGARKRYEPSHTTALLFCPTKIIDQDSVG
jgi:hypothetical protein